MTDFCIIFVAKNFDNSVHYYRDQLGFTVCHEWNKGPGNRGSVFRVGDGKIEILELKSGMEYKQPQNFEISMEVENVDDFYKKVQSNGLPIRGQLADKPWGQRAFSLSDPDDIKLIFYTCL